MSAGIIGKKLGMTRVFEASGTAVAVTVIEAGPCPVVQTKSVAKEGYDAVQLGFGTKKHANRPTQGHFRKAGVEPTAALREIRGDDLPDVTVGQAVNLGDLFSEGDLVDVTGLTKGRGFAGHVRRWNFRGGKKSHGGEKDHRRPGSIGTSAWPSRVVKGRKMAGHMGHAQVTAQNLTIIKMDSERHLLIVKGAVPGPKNGLVVISRASKPGSHAGATRTEKR